MVLYKDVIEVMSNYPDMLDMIDTYLVTCKMMGDEVTCRIEKSRNGDDMFDLVFKYKKNSTFKTDKLVYSLYKEIDKNKHLGFFHISVFLVTNFSPLKITYGLKKLMIKDWDVERRGGKYHYKIPFDSCEQAVMISSLFNEYFETGDKYYCNMFKNIN